MSVLPNAPRHRERHASPRCYASRSARCEACQRGARTTWSALDDEGLRERAGGCGDRGDHFRRSPLIARLDIIGAGRVGRTLGRLWHDRGHFEIGRIVNRGLESAEAAARFVGAGRPAIVLSRDDAADAVLIAVPDEAVEPCARALAEAGALRPGAVVFHCSGALASTALADLARLGIHTASVHPVRSFADPEHACRDFAGTRCAIEGDAAACAVLRPAFGAIGAELFDIDAEHKRIYHAGAVVACNYLVTLFDAAQDAYARAGIDAPDARSILLPLMRGTLDNLERAAPADALTGPIARGEAKIVAGHLAALEAWRPEIAELYRALARHTLPLARAQGSASEDQLAALEELLGD